MRKARVSLNRRNIDDEEKYVRFVEETPLHAIIIGAAVD